MNLDQALKRIEELEKEVDSLKFELKKYENKSLGGRHKHDEKWQAAYDKWVLLHEDGHNLNEVMEKTGISRRTYYRYKAYYDALK